MATTDRMFLAHIEDMDAACASRNAAMCSGFMDMQQQSDVIEMSKHFSAEYLITGGFSDAERKVIIFMPEYGASPDDFLCILRLSHSPKETVGHRDYLGALMGLGIDRENTGDILVSSDGAQIIIKKELAAYLKINCCKAGRATVTADILPLSQLQPLVQETLEKKASVSSLRADALIAAAFNLSRSDASEAVASQQIYVNDVLLKKPDKLLTAGDKIKYWHHGRVILSEIGGTGRKGRTFVKFRVYQ